MSEATAVADLPSLSTERLLLRQRDARDREALIALNGDPEVMRYLHPVEPPEQRAATADGRIARRFPDGLGYWAVLRRAEPAGMIGYVGLLPAREAGQGPEVSYRFFRRWQGQGYACEAMRALLAHGFDALGQASIEIHTHPENGPSLALARRLGFETAGTVRHEFGLWSRLILRREAWRGEGQPETRR